MVNHVLTVKYYLQIRISRDKGSADKNSAIIGGQGGFMVRDISEKPASGEKSPSATSRKDKRKAKPKSAAIATRKPRSGRSRAAKSPKAPVTDAASAGAKPAKSQASIASTHTTAGSTTNTPGSTTKNTAVGENAPHDTAPIAGAKDPGMQYQNLQNQNSETPKSPILNKAPRPSQQRSRKTDRSKP